MFLTKILFVFLMIDSSNLVNCSIWDDLSILSTMFDHFRSQFYGMFRSTDNSIMSKIGSKLTSVFRQNSNLLCYGFASVCCDVTFIGDITGLEITLRNKLHGQHLVIEMVTKSLRNHLRFEPKKALTLSFHGWTGGGKNHVSKIIADHLFTDGMRSSFVHLFVSTIHFPHWEKISSYKDNLISWIKGNVSSCPRSVFIFDEMDKMVPGLIDAIKPFLDYHTVIDGLSYNKAIFIFLSNTGGIELTKLTYNFWKTGRSRTEISFKDVDKLLMDGAFNERSGLQHSGIVENNLIDFYVPFLPLERDHVKLCTRDEITERNGIVSEELLDAVADNLVYYPPNQRLFSTSGCKLVGKKLDLLIE